MADKTYTLDDVVKDVAKEVLPKAIAEARGAITEDLTKMDTRVAVVEKINGRVEELADGMTKLKTALDDGIAEIQGRMGRAEKTGRQDHNDALFRISNDGRSFVPRVSDGLAAAIHKAASSPLTMAALQAFKRDLLTDGLHTAGEEPTIIPTEYMTEFLSLIAVWGQYRKMARVVPMSEKTQAFPAFDNDGVEAQWVAESGTPTNQVFPDFKSITFTNEILMALTAIPVPYLQDARPPVQQMITEIYARKFARAEDVAGFTGTGTGVAAQDPFVGILHAVGVADVPLIAGTTAADLTPEDLAAAIDELEDEALEGAAFHFNRTAMTFLRTLKDSAGRYIFQDPSADEPAKIFDYPIRKVRILPKFSTVGANTPFGFLGNMYYAHLGDRVSIQIGFNENPLWANLKVLGRAYERVATGVGIPEGFAVIRTN